MAVESYEDLVRLKPQLAHPDWESYFDRMMNVDRDEVAEVLSGHLFLEARINSLLDAVLIDRNKAFPRDGRSDLSRKVDFLHALLGSKRLWDDVRQINRLRNELAHRMEGAKYKALKDAFIKNVESGPHLVRWSADDEMGMSEEEQARERFSCALTTRVVFCANRIEKIIEIARRVKFADLLKSQE